MQKKTINSYVFILVSLLSFNGLMYGVAAYIPEAIRSCIAHIHEFSDQKMSNEFKELYAMITENRVIASEELVRKVVAEAYNIVQDSAYGRNSWKKEAHNCLREYLQSLNDRSVVLTLKGDEKYLSSLPHTAIHRARDIDSRSRDLIYLRNELTSLQNIELCGDKNLTLDEKQTRIPRPTTATNPSIMFTPSMMSSPNVSQPSFIFATGVSSLTIEVWAMGVPASTLVNIPSASPINMQFAIPGTFKTEKPISLELHFLVKKEGFANANARVRINSLYVSDEEEFSMANPTTFSYTDDSANFTVKEPSNADDLVHVIVDVPLEKVGIDRADFAVLSVTRIPVSAGDAEYQGNIYLAAAAFKYTSR